MGRTLICVLALAALAACAASREPIRFEPVAGEPPTEDGLYRVRERRVGALYLRPGAGFADYDAVVLDPVAISFGLQAPPLAEPARERLERIYREEFERELSAAGFEIVTEPGFRVMRVRGLILDLEVRPLPPTGRDEQWVGDSGRLAFLLEIRDSQSGIALARAADRRMIQPDSLGMVGRGGVLFRGYRNNATNTWGALRETLAGYARILREGLEDLRAVPVQPPATAAPPPEASRKPARATN